MDGWREIRIPKFITYYKINNQKFRIYKTHFVEISIGFSDVSSKK